MTKTEERCKDMADVCELAHNRTVRECRAKHIQVNCKSEMQCNDSGNLHEPEDLREMAHYTADAQEIFDRHYDHITEVTGL